MADERETVPNDVWRELCAAQRDGAILHSVVSVPDPLATGVALVDDAMGGGLPVGGFTVLAGDPGSGKSTLVCQLARSCAVRGTNALFVTLEMEHGEVWRRMASCHSVEQPGLVPFAWSRRTDSELSALAEMERFAGEAVVMARSAFGRELTEKEEAAIGDAAIMRCAPTLTDPCVRATLDLQGRTAKHLFVREGGLDGTADVRDVCAIVENFRKNKWRGLLVIDYCQLMDAPGEDEVRKVTEVSRTLQRTLRGTEVACVLVSSLRKAQGGERAAAPSLDRLKGSAQVAYDAKAALFVTRDEDGGRTLTVAKNRSGPSGQSVRLALDYAHGRMERDTEDWER